MLKFPLEIICPLGWGSGWTIDEFAFAMAKGRLIWNISFVWMQTGKLGPPIFSTPNRAIWKIFRPRTSLIAREGRRYIQIFRTPTGRPDGPDTTNPPNLNRFGRVLANAFY